jgi:hypothetical protein
MADQLRRGAESLESRVDDDDDAAILSRIADQLEILERPPGLLRRVSHKARTVASTQWANLVGELEESREAMVLIRTRARGERELSREEREQVREQLMDLVRMFPAGLIAALNTSLPVPGTSVFTPWLLVKLGLMPSRWREAHLLDQLHRQQQRLQRIGHSEQAAAIRAILAQLEHDAEQREAIRREGRLLTHWDANGNGIWDASEIAAYEREVTKLRELARAYPARKRWFFEHEGEVFGAIRLTEIGELDETNQALLVCFDGKTGWVALEHVLEP